MINHLLDLTLHLRILTSLSQVMMHEAAGDLVLIDTELVIYLIDCLVLI